MYRGTNYSSKLLADAVEQLSSLPGIGAKSALRFALHLLEQPLPNVERFSNSILAMRSELKRCQVCHMISDSSLCSICNDSSRDNSLICVVESIRDVLSIENSGEYRGVYHILGGIISPLEGVSPSDLNIGSLEERVKEGAVKELLIALSTTMEGETTSFFLYRKLVPYGVEFSTIARGVGFGDNLEYTDQMTLARSIANRQPFKPQI